MSIYNKFISIKKKWLPSAKDKILQKEALDKKIEFYSQFIQEGELSFDVGSNMGNRIEPLLAIGAVVVAIEPQKKCIDYLANKFRDKIILVTKGLDKQEGIKTFYISNASTISSFSEDWIDSVKNDRFKNYKWDRTEQVEMTTLDALIAKYGKPVFIKIDVEGSEFDVLQGLSHSVDCISFEYTVPEQTSKVLDCINHLEKVNGNTVYNYSVGESMLLNLKEWMTADDICKHIQSTEFIKTSFGDIYARCIK